MPEIVAASARRLDVTATVLVVFAWVFVVIGVLESLGFFAAEVTSKGRTSSSVALGVIGSLRACRSGSGSGDDRASSRLS